MCKQGRGHRRYHFPGKNSYKFGEKLEKVIKKLSLIGIKFLLKTMDAIQWRHFQDKALCNYSNCEGQKD